MPVLSFARLRLTLTGRRTIETVVGNGDPVKGWPLVAKVVATAGILLWSAAVIETVELLWPGHGWRNFKIWLLFSSLSYTPVALYALHRRYGEERATQEYRGQERYRVRWNLAWPVVAVALAGLFLYHGLTDIGPSWAADHGGGRVGTFVVQSVDCGNVNCSPVGGFASDDGTDIREGIVMHDAYSGEHHVGDRIRARDTGDGVGVFAETGSHSWYVDAFFILGGSAGLIALLWWSVVVWHRWRRRASRRARVCGAASRPQKAEE